MIFFLGGEVDFSITRYTHPVQEDEDGPGRADGQARLVCRQGMV